MTVLYSAALGDRTIEQVRETARDGFWYLATPYTDYPVGTEAAFHDAVKAQAFLMAAGVLVFCPIAHTHPAAAAGLVGNHDFWLRADRPFMKAAMGIIVVEMNGWDTSRGIKAEREEFRRLGKPELFMKWPLGED
jgi:hypothetical protein